MMDNFLGVFALVFYIVPVVCVIIIIPLRRKKMQGIAKLLNQQAVKRNGTVKYMLGIPYFLQYDFSGCSGTISMSHKTKKNLPMTKFSAEFLGDEKFVANIGFSDKVEVSDLSPVELGNSEFDGIFKSYSNDVDEFLRILDQENQNLLLRWKRRNSQLSILNRRIIFQVNELIIDKDVLDEFINSGEKIISKINLMK